MAKFRNVNTRFWNDAFISQLNPLDRYLFLYFITNEHTNICGAYELPIKYIAIETGIDTEMIPKMVKRLKGKVYYIDGWVWVVNFTKYQASGSKTVTDAIDDEMAKVPLKIREKILSLHSRDRVHIGYPYGSDTVTTNTTTLTNTNEGGVGETKEPFDLFFEAYPKRELKKKAREVWERKKLDSDLKVILEFIDKAKLTDRWKKGYIKQPPAFLTGECWNDDLDTYNDFIKKGSGSITLQQP